MAISDTLPATLQVNTRDEWAQLWLRSYGNRLAVNNPSADISQATAPGSAAYIDAMALADCLAIMSANSQTIAGTALIANMSEAQLTVKGQDLGVPWPQAVGAAGWVIASTSTNGSTIRAGDSLSNLLTRMRYEHASATDIHYSNGQLVPVIGVDTGPLSNADAGTQLQWDSPRDGCFSQAIVAARADGTGLTGGADKASVETYRSLITYGQANESASGNEAAAIKWAEDSLNHGVQVEKAFYYPAIYGPGNNALVFTVPPSGVSGSRIPTGPQIAQVIAYVQSQLPADDGVIGCVLDGVNPTLIGRVDWADGAPQWSDFTPWPNYIAGDKFVVTNSPTPTATVFTVATASGSYTSAQQPSNGKTIALFNSTTGKFSKKIIASFSGSGPWTITCDTSTGQTDTVFVPTYGTLVSPWSDSLQSVADTLITYINTMGPGEQSAGLGDGRKQLRSPRPSTKAWPITITSQVESNVTALTGVDSFSLVVGLGLTVSIGVPGTYSNLLTNPLIAIHTL